MQSLIDRVAGMFGFQRIEAPRNDESTGGLRSPAIAAHLRDESKFDWKRASAGTVSFSYNDGDTFHYAIGKDGWMPLSFAVFAMAGNRTDGQSLIASVISDSLWLDPSSERYTAWISDNEKTFHLLQNIEGVASANETEFSQSKHMSPAAVSYIFRQQWRQRFPSSGEDYLAISDAHAGYYEHPAIIDARKAVQAAYIHTLELARNWFDAHGFEVSNDQNHIRIDTYRPLFYVGEQSY